MSTEEKGTTQPTTTTEKPKEVGAKKRARKKAKRKGKRKKVARKKLPSRARGATTYPRHAVDKCLRIPRAILEQNAGRACTDKKAAEFVGVGWSGPFGVEISSALKYGWLGRPSSGHVEPTALAKQALRPQKAGEDLAAIRGAVLNAPQISDVYKHYRGENLPDRTFFNNALQDTFKIPDDKVERFKEVFLQSLKAAQLLEEHKGKYRVLDVATAEPSLEAAKRIKKLGKDVQIKPTDTCFVMMPFAGPLGDYYSLIYEPAIEKAGLRAVRADDEIFGTGKIMDQIWSGINAANVLIAELTSRNPNVFYELGLAHALQKPVVLVSANEGDVPFDLQHIRVIYYDVKDPFWGKKLIDKVAENILSALKNPDEAILPRTSVE